MESPPVSVKDRPTHHLPLTVTPSSGSPWIVLFFLIPPALFHVIADQSGIQRQDDLWALVFCDLFFGSFSLALGYYMYRMSGLGASVSVDGLSPTCKGESQWTLPWSRLGELRKSRPRFAERFDPRSLGVDVIDSDGVFQFRIPFAMVGDTRHPAAKGATQQYAMFWREVRVRAPGSAKIDTPPSRAASKPTLRQALSLFVLGLAATAAGIGALALSIHGTAAGADATRLEAIARSPGLTFAGLLGFFTGMGVLVAGGSALSRARKPALCDAAVLPDPIEGPRIDDHAAFHGAAGTPIIALEEHVRYRIVDPEYHRRNRQMVRSAAAAMWWIYPIVVSTGIVAGLLESLGGLDAERVYRAFSGIVLWVVVAHFAVWRSSLRRETCDDTIVRQGNDIYIVGPDGSQFTFPVSQLSEEKQARRRLNDLGFTDVLRSGRTRYRLNRAQLFASEIPLDHGELKA